MTKVLERFNMLEAKSAGSALLTNCKMNAKQCSRSENEKGEMKKVWYASNIDNLMYAMVCTIGIAYGSV